MIDFNVFRIFSKTADEVKAAELFAEEINVRTGKRPEFSADSSTANFIFKTDESVSRDGYRIECLSDSVTVFASGIRGFIYGFGMFLRKIVPVCGVPVLTEDITGEYAPDK